MEEFLNSDIAIAIAGAITALVAMGLLKGVNALIKSFKDSSNKLDDQAIPLLESIKESIEGSNKKGE